MISRLNDTSNLLTSAFIAKLEVIDLFNQSPNNKSLFDIYVAYSACVYLREFMETNQENSLLDFNPLDVFADELNNLFNKIEACEALLESLYMSEMSSIKSIHQFNAYENNSFMQSLNSDISKIEQNIYHPSSSDELMETEHNPSTLQTANANPQPSKLYIRLDLGHEPCITNGGILTSLLKKPQIVELSPFSATPELTRKTKTTIFGDFETVRYIHDCGNLSEDQIKNALSMFNTHYYTGSDSKPYTFFNPLHPMKNEIIDNLIIAVNNMSLEPSERQPLLKQNTVEYIEDTKPTIYI